MNVQHKRPTLDKSTLKAMLLAFTFGMIFIFATITTRAEPLYVANYGSHTITEFTAGGVGSVVPTTGLNGPTGVVFDSAGNFYITNQISNQIVKVTPGGVSSVFASTGPNPTGLAIDIAGNLYAAIYSGNTIQKFTPAGVSSNFASGLSGPYGLAFDSSGNLYVANAGTSSIMKFTPGGVGSFFASTGGSGARGLAFDSAGNLYVANYSSGTIYRITPAGTGSLFATVGGGPHGLAFDSSGNLFVAQWGSNSIVKITPGGVISTFANTGLSQPQTIAFKPSCPAQTLITDPVEPNDGWIISGHTLLYESGYGIGPTAGSALLHMASLDGGRVANKSFTGNTLAEGSITVTFDIGNYNNVPFAVIDLAQTGLTANGIVLTPVSSNTPAPALGTFKKWTLNYEIGSGHALLGETLGFQIVVPDNGEVKNAAFDNLIISQVGRPTANAGPDQSIRAGSVVDLDGSASFDDNTASSSLVYSWSFSSKPAGSAAVLTGANTATPSFVADIDGDYVVELEFTNECGLSDTDEVVISSNNLAPTANAGSDRLVVIGNTVNLDGSGSSDPEDDALTYSWSITSAPGAIPTLTDANTATPSFTPVDEGVYVLTLGVSDFIGPGTPDTVEITATTAEGFAENRIVAACTIVEGLSPGQVTTKGNQNALCNFLSQAIKALQKSPPHTATAIDKLEKSIERTDGCVLRGSPDGNGPGRDWVTDCAAQAEVYQLLNDALNALATP